MCITIKITNSFLMNRVHNYFYNKNVQTMLCNDETELSLFNLSQGEADFLLAAFTKRFHLKPAMQHPLAAWAVHDDTCRFFVFDIMNKDKTFMVTIHVVAGVLMIAVCWLPSIVGDISVWNKLFCTVAIVLLLLFHYWCQQYEP